MIYSDMINTDKSGRLIECPVCGNTEFTENADYCRICGQTRRNHCIQECGEVEHFNPANARFCETCGARTVFFAQGLLLPWDKVAKENKSEVEIIDIGDDELPF